jgi:hypothetical protein
MLKNLSSIKMTILVFKNVYLFTIDPKFMFGLHKIYITNSQNREYFKRNIFLNLQARRCSVPQQNLSRHLFFSFETYYGSY